MLMIDKTVPRVLACVPVYTAVTPKPYMHHLCLSQETGRAEAKGLYKVRWTCAGPKNQIAIARNWACQAAQNFGADRLLFIDDDMLTPADMITKLMEHDVPIVSPIFFRGGGNHDPLVFDLDEDGKRKSMRDYPVDSLFEAPGGTGTGVMLIKVEVLNAMEKPYFFQPKAEDEGMDLTFCARAREAGFPTYCDSSLLVEQMKNDPGSVGFEQWMTRKEDAKYGQEEKL